MKRTLILILGILITTTAVVAQEMKGTWHGALQLNSLKLNLVLHVVNDRVCTLDSPDQGAKDIRGKVMELTAGKLNVQFPLLNASYDAELKDGKLTGSFKQNGFTLPLTMERGELVRQRPQTPQPPFPYETREVTFSHDSITLAGTLTLPVPPQPSPKGKKAKSDAGVCLLMVTGSGLQDRDETLFDHKPFAVIADYLARHGIATLRYDDRGFGKSTGDPTQCTTADFAEDAAAGVEFLRALEERGENIEVRGTRCEVRGMGDEVRGTGGGKPMFSKVGILGHSEGGSIAFMLGARQLPDFIVALAAPGIQGDTLIVEQTNAMLSLEGQPANMTRRTMHFMMAMQEQNPWYQYFVSYDPSADIAATRCPVFALNGSLDKQVLPESNLGAIEKLMGENIEVRGTRCEVRGTRGENRDTRCEVRGTRRENRDTRCEVRGTRRQEARGEKQEARSMTKLYPGLNHLFQHAMTGAVAEYGSIEETISEEVLQDIVEWVDEVRGKR